MCTSESTRETEPWELFSPFRAQEAEGQDQGGSGEKAPGTIWEVKTIELGGWVGGSYGCVRGV